MFERRYVTQMLDYYNDGFVSGVIYQDPQKDHKVVAFAIRHICGSHASFYKKNNRWWVNASGYYNCVGS